MDEGLRPAMLNGVPAGKFNRASHLENTLRPVLSPSIHKFVDVFTYSGLSAE